MMTTFHRAIDTVRVLSADCVQAANSGHPGMPMGAADFAFTLWAKYLRHDPKNPDWLLRDRFALSAGHGSMLIYSLLHLFGYDLPMSELKNFRQWDSKTPGHPEFGHTPGVDVTTGPLGSGLSSLIGMAMASKNLKARMGENELFNQRFFGIAGDGCMMEGCSAEAISLAGHLKLDNIVLFYDDNQITIEGSTDLAFSEDVGARFRACGWHTISIDGHDVEQIENALEEGIATTGKPTLILGRTVIGKGSPNKGGSASCHGSPLGPDEVKLVKEALGFPVDECCYIPEDVKELIDTRSAELTATAAETNAALKSFLDSDSEKATLLQALTEKSVPADLKAKLLSTVDTSKNIATRVASGNCMQVIASEVPSFMGGAADLAPSTQTYLKADTSFQADNPVGRNFHFGVREFAMGLCANGMALFGTAIPYTSTFFVFSDYMKPAIRLASLQNLHQVYVFTHDSFYVGEDGPTHQPIEQLLMLRTIPGVTVIRPAEAFETAHAWDAAMRANGPVALILTRQNVNTFSPEMAERIDLEKGAYVVSEDENFEVILIGSGSETGVALEAAEILRGEGKKVRVVSAPSWELFDKQSAEYKESVLPAAVTKRVSVEAASTLGWCKFTGCEGLNIGLDHFGASAPGTVLAEKFGFTGAQVADKVRTYLG